MDQAYKSYKNILAKINEILAYEDDMKKSFSEGGDKKIRQTLDLIIDQLEKVYKNENVEPTDGDKLLVKETIDVFINIAIDKPITPIFRDLSKTYLLLVFNWNQALGKVSSIDKNIKLVDMIIKGQLTMLDTIHVLRQFLPKIKAMEQYSPPSFDLSRAYLNSLEEGSQDHKSKCKKLESKKSKSQKNRSKKSIKKTKK
jgi:hypothetical protein